MSPSYVSVIYWNLETIQLDYDVQLMTWWNLHIVIKQKGHSKLNYSAETRKIGRTDFLINQNPIYQENVTTESTLTSVEHGFLAKTYFTVVKKMY